MSKKWETLLQQLKLEIETLNADANSVSGTVELDQSRVGRLSRMDALQSHAMNNAITARRKKKLIAVEAAFNRLANGEFGYCVTCGADIPLKRLELDPTTASCMKCIK